MIPVALIPVELIVTAVPTLILLTLLIPVPARSILSPIGSSLILLLLLSSIKGYLFAIILGY